MANHPNRSKKFGPRDVDMIADAVSSLDILINNYPWTDAGVRDAHRRRQRNARRALDRLRAVKT